MPAQSVADDDASDGARGGFSMRREGALRSARQAAHAAQGSHAPRCPVAVEAPRVPLITLAVSMFGGAALGAVQARARPGASSPRVR